MLQIAQMFFLKASSCLSLESAQGGGNRQRLPPITALAGVVRMKFTGDLLTALVVGLSGSGVPEQADGGR